MSQSTRSNLLVVVAIITVALSLFSFFQSFAVIPYRVQETEKSIKALQEDTRTAREILIRIEERVKRVQEDLNKR